MRVCRLFCPELSPGENLLSEEESHHAVHVLRLRAGDAVQLFDGAGRVGQAIVGDIRRNRLTVAAQEITIAPYDVRCRITLAVAIVKAHRQAYLVEKCTELGVAAFQPLITERSVVRPAEAAVDRWLRRAVEAAKQAKRAWVPVVEPPRTLEQVLARVDRTERLVVTEPDSSAPSFSEVLSAHPSASRLVVFVGPEGGWSATELERLHAAGAVGANLAPTVLRTETAAVAVCAAAALLGRGE